MTGSEQGIPTYRSAYLEIIDGSRRGLLASAIRGGLSALSVGYGVGARLESLQSRLRSTRLPCKVISVGNLTVGGTGKTPMVEWIARQLVQAGHSVAIVSRGYGAAQDSGMNDEGKVLAENLDAVPHVQDVDRVAAGLTAIKNYDPEVIVLDDGFQHRRLARDLDIVMIDATAPFGFGHLLPRGLLRESQRALRRADMVVLSRCEQVSEAALQALSDRIRTYAPEVSIAQSTHEPVALDNLSEKDPLKLDWFLWNKAAAFCGIANPRAFLHTLEKLDCTPTFFKIFRDHNIYAREQVENLVSEAARGGADAVVTTQKDAVKLADCTDLKLPILRLKIQLHLRKGAEILNEWLRTLLSGAQPSNPNGPAPHDSNAPLRARRNPNGH